MASGLTSVSPLPFLGFTLTLPDAATVVEIDPQPYNNTKEVVFLNLSAADRMFVQVADLSVTAAYAEVEVGNNQFPLAGDTLTIDGVVLTGVAGAQTPGSDDYSASVAATATLSVNAPALAVGDTVSFPDFPFDPTLTGAAGGGAPGTNTFDSAAGSAALIAASIASALTAAGNDTANTVESAVSAGPIVTMTYIRGGSSPNGELVDSSTAPAGNMTGSLFAGGQDAIDSATGLPATYNPDTIRNNIIAAVNDGANSFTGTAKAHVIGVNFRQLRLIAVVPGAGGNSLTLSESTATQRFTLSGPTFAGGKDALPTAAEVTEANSTVVPPGGTVAFSIGSEGSRQPLATSAFWGLYPGSNLGLLARLESGAAQGLNITYVQL